ncbi:hypothetical protein [Zunongwangia sp. HGR-M22]|uniref:hypothetical protein n=1 Tax=Zunongwangia sp. HGR-M22 TaxID=3015168 RepID=UPI0022DE1EF0|nr:hypothetical protein [Zunongwangia sp. HGR-M22]WBL25719.1 hypothetical protein PBT91_00155 [Zunongwangia sp. HGR-M22]
MGDIISSLKEFIWDIIGYLIPGFLLILMFNFIIVPGLIWDNNFLFNWELFMPSLIVVLSYCLGFVVYSLTIFKVRNQDIIVDFLKRKFDSNLNNERAKQRFNSYIGSKHSRYWELSFLKSSTIESAKTFLKNEGYENVDQMKINEMRNILMSRNPEMDDKVYTFMFRSSVFDHVSTILMLVCFIALVQLTLFWIGTEIQIIKIEKSYLVLYFIFLGLIPLLGNSKRMFRSISQRIPFSNLN